MAHDAAEAERDAHGFRRRGFEVTRLMAFVDAAFAFAVTMLVISLDAVPNDTESLKQALKSIPAFAASFALLAQIWWIHTRYTWRFGLEDGPTVRLSMLLVFLVLVYVYPLKILFSTFFAWLSGGWLPPGFAIQSVDDLRTMFIVYGVAWGLLGLVMARLYQHAWTLRESLGLDEGERVAVRQLIVSYLFFPALGLLSALVALALPDRPSEWMLALPGFVYFLMFLQWPVLNLVQRRMQEGSGTTKA